MAGPCWHAGSCGWPGRLGDGPGRRSSPWMRTTPLVRFSPARRTIRSASSSPVGGRLGGFGCRHRAAISLRCQRNNVPGVTIRWRVAPSEASGQARPGPRDPARTGEAPDCSVAAQHLVPECEYLRVLRTPTTGRTEQARTAPEQRADRPDEHTRSPIIDVTTAQVKLDGRILDQDRQLAIHHEASRGQGLSRAFWVVGP
jgi:hypothetical protein